MASDVPDPPNATTPKAKLRKDWIFLSQTPNPSKRRRRVDKQLHLSAVSALSVQLAECNEIERHSSKRRPKRTERTQQLLSAIDSPWSAGSRLANAFDLAPQRAVAVSFRRTIAFRLLTWRLLQDRPLEPLASPGVHLLGRRERCVPSAAHSRDRLLREPEQRSAQPEVP
jgi:hypothetical protein